MAFSESQLETWSHQGSITNSADTANSIKYAINNYGGFPSGINYDVYLSGSYKNDTNIFGESDVDVVVELTSSFYNNLSEEQKQNFNLTIATYGYFDFKKDVIQCLNNYYTEANVDLGNKAIKVFPTHANRLHADVLVCSTYRQYNQFSRIDEFQQGIAFYKNPGIIRVINFPKRHSDIVTQKHQRTNGYFKPLIRIFKNMKKTLVNAEILDKKLVPSYFIECLLYNIPDYSFGTDYSTTVYNILAYLNSNDWNNFKCVNGITPLWGNTTETWDQASAKTFISAVIKMWNSA